MPLTDEQLAKMTTPAWERARAALDAGDTDEARRMIDAAVARWATLQEYSINWIASLLSFVADELGEEAVERALRRTGEQFVRPRRSTGAGWADVSAEDRAMGIARSMVANFGTLEVAEDDEKITLSFRCGSGGRLIDDGRYEGPDAYATLHEPAGRTFGRDALPVYCAHCAVNNEMQPIEWGEAPVSIEHPPTAPGEPCVHHVYRDPAALPAEVYVRLGKQPPA